MFASNYKYRYKNYLSSYKPFKLLTRSLSAFRSCKSSTHHSIFFKCNSGFTLAEVLITVGILMVLIGIVNKFLSSTSLNAGRFAARQESDMLYKVFKGDILREITKTSVNGKTDVTINNHTTIPSIHPNITRVIQEVTVGNFSYQNGCARSTAANDYVSILQDASLSGDQVDRKRTLRIRESLNTQIQAWTNQTANLCQCNNDEVPVILKVDTSPDPDQLVDRYPLAETPKNYIENGGVVGAWMYAVEVGDHKYIHIFQTRTQSNFVSSNNDQTQVLTEVNAGNPAQVANPPRRIVKILTSHDVIDVGPGFSVRTPDPPGHDDDNDDDDDDSSDPSDDDDSSDPSDDDDSSDPSDDDDSSDPSDDDDSSDPSDDDDSSDPPSDPPGDCESTCPYRSLYTYEEHVSDHFCQHQVGYDPFVGCKLVKTCEFCEEACAAPKIFFNGPTCKFSVEGGNVGEVPPECHGHEGDVITSIDGVPCTPNQYSDARVSMSYGIGTVHVEFENGTSCDIDYDSLITKSSTLYDNMTNPSLTYVPYYVRTCDCLMASVYTTYAGPENQCPNGSYFSRQATAPKSCAQLRDVERQEMIDMFDGELFEYYITGTSGDKATCYGPGPCFSCLFGSGLPTPPMPTPP